MESPENHTEFLRNRYWHHWNHASFIACVIPPTLAYYGIANVLHGIEHGFNGIAYRVITPTVVYLGIVVVYLGIGWNRRCFIGCVIPPTPVYLGIAL